MQAAVQRVENEQRTVFIKSSVVGLLLYIIFFAVILFFARLPLRAKTSESAVPILEAELVETIQAPKLHEKLTESVKIKEETVSQDLSKGKQDAGNLKSTTDVQNQTVKSSDPLILTHGPQVISSTIPHLPEYLKNQNLKTNVLIEFLVAADGNSSPAGWAFGRMRGPEGGCGASTRATVSPFIFASWPTCYFSSTS